jgi:hypothetical protein
MLMAVAAKYFPAPGQVADYTNNPKLYEQVSHGMSNYLPDELIHKINDTGRVAKAGDVKYIFTTQSGPGPIAQPMDESLIDPDTGYPRAPGPKHQKLQIK